MASKSRPDALKAAPNIYTLLLENERVRVFSLLFKPGDVAPMHSHPDHVAYALSDGKLRITTPEGKSDDLDIKAGQTVWLPAQDHEAVNIGSTDTRLVVTELKKAA